MTTVRARRHGDEVLELVLDKPPANAIDERLLRDLHEALAAARDDDSVRAVVLGGAGSFFSAGFDFSTPRRDDEVALDLYRLYREVHLELLELAKPTIARIDGHAIAGGFVLALACDHRFVLDGDYRVGMNEVAVGASFPRAAIEIVRLRLSHAAATEMILGASLYSPSETVRLGFAGELVPAEQFGARLLGTAKRLASHPHEAYAHGKAALTAATVEAIKAETDEEALATMAVWITAESRAARRRQREKLRAAARSR